MTSRTQKQKEISITRSSAVEHLAFIASNGEGGIEAVCSNENI